MWFVTEECYLVPEDWTGFRHGGQLRDTTGSCMNVIRVNGVQRIESSLGAAFLQVCMLVAMLREEQAAGSDGWGSPRG